MYSLLRNCLFLFPAETAHHFSMTVLRMICQVPFLRNLMRKWFSPKGDILQKKFAGLSFRNKVGLGAGFDKNAKYLRELDVLGFGFVELGTVTPLPQEGNEKPRLFRLPKDQALINRMGFNNDGVDVIRQRLEKWKAVHGHEPNRMIIGGNIGKNKITPNEDAYKDYEICFKALFASVDYFTVNVSSPNTPGLRALQGKEALLVILSKLQDINHANVNPKPIFLKIAPDLEEDQLNDIIELVQSTKIAGIVACNTTISRTGLQTTKEIVEAMGNGGLSGKPVQQRSSEVLRYLHQKSNGTVPIMASGGIFTGQDAEEKLKEGASLVQVWTGFIYEGPAIVKKICKVLKSGK